MRRLRAKIEPQPEQPQLLQTVRGYGYRLVDDEG
ncbi:MAG: winged helix-turn-helix domain-containing protein [bacterium]